MDLKKVYLALSKNTWQGELFTRKKIKSLWEPHSSIKELCKKAAKNNDADLMEIALKYDNGTVDIDDCTSMASDLIVRGFISSENIEEFEDKVNKIINIFPEPQKIIESLKQSYPDINFTDSFYLQEIKRMAVREQEPEKAAQKTLGKLFGLFSIYNIEREGKIAYCLKLVSKTSDLQCIYSEKTKNHKKYEELSNATKIDMIKNNEKEMLPLKFIVNEYLAYSAMYFQLSFKKENTENFNDILASIYYKNEFNILMEHEPTMLHIINRSLNLETEELRKLHELNNKWLMVMNTLSEQKKHFCQLFNNEIEKRLLQVEIKIDMNKVSHKSTRL